MNAGDTWQRIEMSGRTMTTRDQAIETMQLIPGYSKRAMQDARILTAVLDALCIEAPEENHISVNASALRFTFELAKQLSDTLVLIAQSGRSIEAAMGLPDSWEAE